METLCEYCKQPFIPKRSDAIYCGASCRQMAHIVRKVNKDNSNLETLNYPSINNQVRTLTDNEAPFKEVDEPYPSRINEISVNSNETLTNKQLLLPEGEENYPSNTKEVSVNTGEIHYESAFIEEIKHTIESRNYLDILNDINVSYESDIYEVNLRYRCLVECLLTLSEMRYVKLDDLKEICNAFIDFVDTESFKTMESDGYPYTNEIYMLLEKLKNFCLNADENQKQEFRFKRETKIKMLATRWELSNSVKRISFKDLKFD